MPRVGQICICSCVHTVCTLYVLLFSTEKKVAWACHIRFRPTLHMPQRALFGCQLLQKLRACMHVEAARAPACILSSG